LIQGYTTTLTKSCSLLSEKDIILSKFRGVMPASKAYGADAEYLVGKAINTGYQISSSIVPPAYMAFVFARRGRAFFSINRLLRATWVGGLVGTAGSGGLAYIRYANSSEDFLRARRIESVYDTNRIRLDDHAMIGAILCSVLTPALLWKRANTFNLILGGAGIGSSIGLVTHYARLLFNDPPQRSKK